MQGSIQVTLKCHLVIYTVPALIYTFIYGDGWEKVSMHIIDIL